MIKRVPAMTAALGAAWCLLAGTADAGCWRTGYGWTCTGYGPGYAPYYYPPPYDYPSYYRYYSPDPAYDYGYHSAYRYPGPKLNGGGY